LVIVSNNSDFKAVIRNVAIKVSGGGYFGGYFNFVISKCQYNYSNRLIGRNVLALSLGNIITVAA